MPVVEMYSYAAAGAVEKKKLQYTISPFTQTLEAVYSELARWE